MSKIFHLSRAARDNALRAPKPGDAWKSKAMSFVVCDTRPHDGRVLLLFDSNNTGWKWSLNTYRLSYPYRMFVDLVHFGVVGVLPDAARPRSDARSKGVLAFELTSRGGPVPKVPVKVYEVFTPSMAADWIEATGRAIALESIALTLALLHTRLGGTRGADFQSAPALTSWAKRCAGVCKRELGESNGAVYAFVGTSEDPEIPAIAGGSRTSELHIALIAATLRALTPEPTVRLEYQTG